MLEAITSVLFPKYCYVCNKEGRYICEKCFKDYLNINLTQRCHLCGKKTRFGFMHNDCKLETHLDGLIYLTVFNQLAKDLVHDGKYSEMYSIFSELSILMGQYLKRFYHFDSQTIIMPIPMYYFKKNLRGFNQAEILAKGISRINNISYVNGLQRVKNTKTQVGMLSEQRENNLSNAFKLKTENVVKDKIVLLVDDVFTSGTTLKECSKLLKLHGAAEVLGFTFAKSRELDT